MEMTVPSGGLRARRWEVGTTRCVRVHACGRQRGVRLPRGPSVARLNAQMFVCTGRVQVQSQEEMLKSGAPTQFWSGVDKPNCATRPNRCLGQKRRWIMSFYELWGQHCKRRTSHVSVVTSQVTHCQFACVFFF